VRGQRDLDSIVDVEPLGVVSDLSRNEGNRKVQCEIRKLRQASKYIQCHDGHGLEDSPNTTRKNKAHIKLFAAKKNRNIDKNTKGLRAHRLRVDTDARHEMKGLLEILELIHAEDCVAIRNLAARRQNSESNVEPVLTVYVL
jgi:hypothetical protein